MSSLMASFDFQAPLFSVQEEDVSVPSVQANLRFTTGFEELHIRC